MSANLSQTELYKYRGQSNDRVPIFLEKYRKGASFELVSGAKVKLKHDSAVVKKLTEGKSLADVLLEINDGTKTKKYVKFNDLKKTTEFGGRGSDSSTGNTGGKAHSERQERGVKAALQNAIKTNGFVMTEGALRGKKIIVAEKKEQGSLPHEPYIDLVLKTESQTYGVSMKGTSAPSIAGGGLAGINVIVPTLIPKVYAAIENYMKNTLKLKQGMVLKIDDVPNFYVKVSDADVMKILAGTKAMGGPVTHMYIGPMDVTSSITQNTIRFNSGQGKFYSLQEYKEKIGSMYFRVRKRDVHSSGKTRIEYTRKNAEGLPMLLCQPIPNGKNNARLVIVAEKDVPAAAPVIKIR